MALLILVSLLDSMFFWTGRFWQIQGPHLILTQKCLCFDFSRLWSLALLSFLRLSHFVLLILKLESRS